MNSTPSSGFSPPLISPNVTTVMKAIAEPTDRSMPALVITNVMPTAMTMMKDAWVRILMKLVIVPKRGLMRMNRMANTTITAVRPIPSKSQRRSA